MPACSFNQYSTLGIGLGLRAQHVDYILQEKPAVEWFEIIAENYLIPGGAAHENLVRILDSYRVVVHGVSLYFGSPSRPPRQHLRLLKELVKLTKTPWLSDHLCWGSIDGTYSHDLLPLPYTTAVAKLAARRIREVSDYLEIPIIVENVSSYTEFTASRMTEWEFFNEVADRADCGILLDVNNVYVSAHNHGFDPLEYLGSIPAERVAQMHLAGHSACEHVLIDTHSTRPPPPVWKLYREALKRFQRTPTLLEWDAEIPAFPVLQREAQKAQKLLEK